MVQPWKRFVSYSESKTVTHDPAFLILGIYLREMKTYVHTELVFKCSWQHLHTKAPKWKQLRCASTNEQINKCSIATQHNIQFSSVTQSCPTLRPHEPQRARPPCPSPTPGVYSNSCPLSPWCHPTISSSVVPFSSRLQSFPALGSFPVSQFFASSGQSIGASASASTLPMNIQI